MSLSVLSWNILGPATRDVADYGFIPGDYGRLGKHLEIINQFQSDILCFQEVDLTTLHFFNNFLLSKYQQATYHEKGAHGGIVVYVRKSQFKLIESIGSVLKSSEVRAPGAFCGVFLEDISDKSHLFVASVHLSKSSHPQAISQAVSQVSDLCENTGKALPFKTIFAGDFNTMYEDMRQTVVPTMSQILNKKLLMFEHESCTSRLPSGELTSIDHILYTGFEINLEKSCVVTSKYEHIQSDSLKKIYEHGLEHTVQPEIPSDHSPVLAIFK
jgi:endonuclease/exonuclease/phosphatase family metal-dependent hydrolase